VEITDSILRHFYLSSAAAGTLDALTVSQDLIPQEGARRCGVPMRRSMWVHSQGRAELSRLLFIDRIWAKSRMAPPDESTDREQLPSQQRTQPMCIAHKSRIAVLSGCREGLPL